MRNSKFGLRAFGLAIMAALGLMAFTAVAAQAENLTDGGKPGLFEILKSSALVPNLTFTGLLEALTGTSLVHGSLLVPGRNLTILCAQGHIEEGKFITDTEALAKILFLECKALVLGKETEEVAGCNVIDSETKTKGHITSFAIILPVKHEGEPYLLIHPHPGKAFTIVEFEAGKGCALPLKNEVKGLLGALVKEKEAVIHLITGSKAIQELLGAKLLFGTFEASVDGNATAELTGTHKGCTWSIV